MPRFFLCVFCSFLSLRLFIIAPFSCVFHRGFAVDTTVQWSVGGRMPSGPGPCKCKTVNNVHWTWLYKTLNIHQSIYICVEDDTGWQV